MIQTDIKQPHDNVADVQVRHGMSPADLTRIVSEAEKHGRAAANNMHAPMQLVELDGQRYKVRCYASRDEALTQLNLMDRVPELLPPCCGRSGRFLVLRYVSGQRLDDAPRPLDQVVKFLAALANVQTPPVSSQAFGRLCRDLGGQEVFRPRTLRLLEAYYSKQLSRPIRWCLQYYDAQPANFVVTDDGKCISVDEKHLLAAPCGFSLIRPLRKFPVEDFEQLSRDYCALMQNDDFNQPSYRDFVFFFYSVSVLALYARCTTRRSMQQRRVLLQLRQRALRVAGVGMPTRLLEQLRWLIPYGESRLMSFARRAVRFLARRVGRVGLRLPIGQRHQESDCESA